MELTEAIPSDWSLETISEFCGDEQLIVDGPFGSNLKNEHYVHSGIPVLTGGNITGNIWNFQNIRFISRAKAQELFRCNARVGDLLTIKIGSVGFTAAITSLGNYEFAIIPANLLRIRVENKDSLTDYLKYFLQSDKTVQILKELGTSTAQPALNLRKFRALNVAKPTYMEQKAIAEALSDIDELINYLKLSIKKTIEIKNGFLHYIFHPLIRNEMISNHAYLASGGTPLTSIKSFYGGEVPWVSISDITNSGKFISQTQRTLTESGLSNSSAFVYPENTLLFAMYASIGKCAIPTVKVSSSQAILGITCKDSLNIKYLYHFLTHIQPELISMGQQGTQSNLNKIIVGSIKFPLLDIFEQEYIAEKLDDLDRSISTDEECLQKYEWLKQGMMNDLLTGKVRLV